MCWRLPTIIQEVDKGFSMTCSDRSHRPCSYCDGAQSQSPPWWWDPWIRVCWREWACSVAGRGAPSGYCAPPRMTCPDVLGGYVVGASSTWRRSKGPAAQCRPDRTHRRCCILPTFSVPGRPWPTEKTRYFPGRETHRPDVVPRQHPADVAEYRTDIRQESDWIWLFGALDNLRGGLRALRICRSV
jgi:hypothetical protein